MKKTMANVAGKGQGSSFFKFKRVEEVKSPLYVVGRDLNTVFHGGT